uniref:F-box domain-containing protein n=3 Tax=Photinus pyralis TaxID=7054 RepID=A0A1Y1LT99_PHOPY
MSNLNEGPKKSSLELIYSGMIFLEQFVENVTSYSSRYNSISSILYAPENLTGKPSKYPNYGDDPNSYTLRSYGSWWNQSEAAQPAYMPQDVDPIPSEDFVTVRFKHGVFPESVCIYETYNPGAVVRIWGHKMGNPWVLLWQGAPQLCLPSSRRFSPPIRQVKELINEIRIEFNQSMLSYYTSLDAVLLTGYQPKSLLQGELLQKGLFDCLDGCECDVNKCTPIHSGGDGLDLFASLPFEVMVHIFQYLDLKSLCRCAQVNKRWHSITFDPTLYREISLKRYWNRVDEIVMKHFITKCRNVKKLDISWCDIEKQITEPVFMEFLEKCCPNITHLSLGHCFSHSSSLGYLAKYGELTDLRLRNCKCNMNEYEALSNLSKLTALDLYCSNISDVYLIKILRANRDLKYLNLDLCELLERLDEVTEVISVFNPNLVMWSSWKTHSITSDGVKFLARCSSLRELDLGWCLLLNDPGNSLERIASNCKHLRRLILCGWRGVNDQLLLPIIRSCKEIRELDLLGMKNISVDICERILSSLPNLRLLDISFCDLIKPEQVVLWRQHYPNITIQQAL